MLGVVVRAMLLTLKNISLAFGTSILLDKVGFNIDHGERVCLIGRNGEGKSSLLKIISGLWQADEGDLVFEDGVKVAMLPQQMPNDINGSVFEVVAASFAKVADLVVNYHKLITDVATDHSLLDKLAVAQKALEDADGWSIQQKIETVLSRLELDGDADFGSLSGGNKRRVLLARELVKDPDLLLLDEPTNHLDIQHINWLETFLSKLNIALLFVSHDRVFMQKVAGRILELDRGLLTDWPGDYKNYLRRQAERANAEQKENARFDKMLSQEEKWIRQGIKARRTRNEGRVRRLEAMREKLSQRRKTQSKIKIRTHALENSGKLVVEAKNISFIYDKQPIIKDFSIRIQRGDKIGLVGPNGCGKSTLLNLLLDKLQPQTGSIQFGTKLQIAYFDQLKTSLKLDKSVRDNIADGSDFIKINDKSRHVISYLQDFMFSPERTAQPVSSLSGGEQNRVLLAKLFSKPANLLVLDEPTNDLDVETLELLEEMLVEFSGTVLLVSHDRSFLDNVATSLIVFDDDKIHNLIGGYQEWQRFKDNIKDNSKTITAKSTNQKTINKSNKIGYKEQRELDALPQKIDKLEAQINDLQLQLADPELYKSDDSMVAGVKKELAIQEAKLEKYHLRWEELEAL